MTEKNESLIRYVVITTKGYWGRGPKLEAALKNAKVNSFLALNSKKETASVAHVYRIELDPVESRYSDKVKAADYSRSMATFSGYEEGDLIEPWVNEFGSLGSWGARSCEKVIELKIK